MDGNFLPCSIVILVGPHSFIELYIIDQDKVTLEGEPDSGFILL